VWYQEGEGRRERWRGVRLGNRNSLPVTVVGALSHTYGLYVEQYTTAVDCIFHIFNVEPIMC